MSTKRTNKEGIDMFLNLGMQTCHQGVSYGCLIWKHTIYTITDEGLSHEEALLLAARKIKNKK